jgi:hypothetical protein
MKRVLPLLLLTATVLFQPVVGAVDLDSLLINSIGGPGALKVLKDVESIHTSGKAFLSGMEGDFNTFFVAPSRYYAEVDFGPFSLVQAFDGETAWQKDHNGYVSELTGYELREVLKSVYFESYSYLLDGRLPGRAEYMGESVRNDTLHHRVAFYPLKTDTVLAFFDHQQGLRRFAVSQVDNLETTSYASDYRDVSGILIPFHIRSITGDTPVESEFFIEQVLYGVPVDTAIFRMETDRLADFRFPEGVDSIRVPFVYRGGHIRLQAKINGLRRAWFILDSGASANIFSESSIADLNLPVVGTMPALGMGGFEEVQLVEIDSISVGGMSLLSQVAGTLDLSALGINRSGDGVFGGILGHDFLSRFPVMISYADSSLTLYNPDSYTQPAGGKEVGFRVTMNVPTIRAELDGIPGDFIVDLGNALGLVVHSEFAQSHRLKNGLTDFGDQDREYGGIGGGISGRTAQATSFSFGDISIASPEVFILDSGAGIAGSTELAGNIGKAILEDFRVLFDYASQRIVFYGPRRQP